MQLCFNSILYAFLILKQADECTICGKILLFKPIS